MDVNFYSPAEVTSNYCDLGEKKALLTFPKQFLLAVVAGVYVGLAAQGYTQVIHTLGSISVARMVGAALFTAALMLVAIAGGELFTGNCLMVIALADRRISVNSMLRNWGVVYVGNFVGAMVIALLICGSGQLDFSGGMLGGYTIKTAVYKTTMGFGKAFYMGIMCNILVCAALWMAAAAKDVAGKILGIFFPVWLFASSGFEHSIANMYFIPAAILAKSNALWVSNAVDMGVSRDQISALGIKSLLLGNLLPVSLGNIVGGAVFIGLAYWLAYLMKSKTPKS